MAEKDMAEKTLEAHNDVFADILNVLVFDGEPVIFGDDLEGGEVHSYYKADGKLHEQERDVAKYWQEGLLRLAFFGFENQSAQDEDMVLRLLGYDGAAYRAQMLEDERMKGKGKLRLVRKPRYPVFTFVLYFGTKRHWSKPRTLRRRLDVPVPAKLEPYFHDYGMNLFEIAWLSEEQVSRFRSDFRIVADYFVQMRKKQDYVPPKGTILHVHELLQLMSVMTGDRRYEDAYNKEMEGGKTTMCEVLDKVQARGEKIGEARGELRKLASLVQKGLLTIQQAAEEQALSVDAFRAECKKYNFIL